MGFPHQTPRKFNRENVLTIRPGQRGVYGLYHSNAWVYVGQSDDIRRRLLEHLNGDNPCITRNRPTHWVDWVTNDTDRIEEELIRELKPVCNRRVG